MKKINILSIFYIILGTILIQEKFVLKTYSLFTTSKEVNGSITVPGKNYCMNNGFNKLGDCMLVMENYSDSVSTAKNYISNKKTPDFSKAAPKNIYTISSSEVSLSDNEYVLSTASHYTLSKDYYFNNETGRFYLGSYDSSGNFQEDYVNDVLNDNYINYYTCGSTETTHDTCATIYQIKDYQIDVVDATTFYRVSKAIRYSSSVSESFDSDLGLYHTNDNHGVSYYYRGNVKNNYVSYAGFIWKIIRQNGDGSIRMIYSGTSTNSFGKEQSIETTRYHSSFSEMAYLGYMYDDSNFSLITNDTNTFNYVRFSENTEYYFADNYEFDQTLKRFRLKGNKIYGTWKDNYSNIISKYKYACFSSTEDDTCEFIIIPTKYVNDYTMTVKIISYSSTDATSYLTPKKSILIKEIVDSWYENNILNRKDPSGNLLSAYLTDNIFCNDREIRSGNGYSLSKSTYYTSYKRIENNSPSLLCNRSYDKFSTTTAIGNGALKYPIGLLTIDEAALAGGLLSNVNTSFYLYSGSNYWTMTPSYFGGSYVYNRTWVVNAYGEIYRGYYSGNPFGVRPVINLSKDVIITSGDGSAEKPYIVALST